jgi:hypothetical protein
MVPETSKEDASVVHSSLILLKLKNTHTSHCNDSVLVSSEDSSLRSSALATLLRTVIPSFSINQSLLLK